MKEIKDTTKLKPIAQGNTAEVYSYSDNTIMKLFREGLPTEPITAEYEKVRLIQQKLPNIPKAYEMIAYKGRYGIVYEKIIGTDMIKCMLKNIFKIKQYSKLLTQIHFDLHKTSVNLNFSVKDKLSAEIDSASVLNKDEKSRIKKYLQNLPNGNSLLHFDFHPGNIIMQDDRPVIIDWMTACSGDPNADVARTFILLQYGELNHANLFVKKLVHMAEKYIGKIYINEYKRLSGISDSNFEQWLLPVAAGRLMEWVSDNEKKQLLKFIGKELLKLKKHNF